jgi:hypothetical protein
MFRRYNRWHSRFDQPDPYDGSYDFSNPQSFNRYAYVQNDPVNLVDPSGLDLRDIGTFSVDIPISSDGGINGFFWAYLFWSPGVGGGGNGGGFDTGGGGDVPAPGFDKDLGEPPCTFNVNISSVSGKELTDMQNEITRIFASGDLNVVFGQPGQANGGSMNVVVTPQFTGQLGARLGSRVNEPSRLGGNLGR